MLQKQAVNINFGQGLETKQDPFQLPVGKFLSLQNSVFTKGGLLQKRNGYSQLTSLPDNTSTLLTTFNGDLTAIGNELNAFSSGTNEWFNKGTLQPVELSTLSLIRSNTQQSWADSVIAPSGLVCTAYADQNPSSLGATIFKYVVADSVTGQNIIQPTQLTTANTTYGTPRVFLLGNNFIIVFTTLVSAVYHLQFIAVSTTNPTIVTTPVDLINAYTPSTGVAFDGVTVGSSLYVACNGASSSGIKVAYLTSNLAVSAAVNPDSSHVATLISVCADIPNSLIYVSYYSSGTGYTLALTLQMATFLAATEIITTGTVLNLASAAKNNVCTIYSEISNNYGYDSGIPSHYINQVTCSSTGTVGTQTTLIRSVGLASKAFIVNSAIYVGVAYQSPYQDTYYVINSSGNVIAQIAYSNGGGYLTTGLPSVNVSDDVAQFAYRYKDLVEALATLNNSQQTTSGGIYTQTGLNLATLTFGQQANSSEIGSNLNITGGITYAYDGYTPVEQGFFLWPDSIELTTATTGGFMTAQQYYYQVTYEWSDNQGNIFRSSPSIPVTITTTGSTSTVTVNVPYLRLTYKTANPVKIVIYRWSAANETYYQVTSISAPTLNVTTSDSVAYVDTLADSSIIGNNIIYTTGGVLENIGAPSFKSVFLFDDRLCGITSEDNNLIWISKQVLENTPVEFSDLQTVYVAPNIGAQGPSGELTCGFPMDDKAILFKATSLLYFNGTGPDATGANSQYSQPILITSTLGCTNQNSIVFTPLGLLFEFQSEAGNQLWLLSRNLTTEYIGAPVESFTKTATVQSAVNVPGTNQVRFTMSSGITLVYDYYYSQWGTFVNVPATSSTLYQGLHTYINVGGQAFQESPGNYLDGNSPVLMSFTTSWLNLAGLQGYQRAYWFYLLGTYYTPHKLNLQIAYNYNPSPTQVTLVQPSNYSPAYGLDLNYGSGNPYGGPGNIEQWKIGLDTQRCQSLQLTLNEVYDPSYGVVAGAGFTLSGLNFVIGIKKGFSPTQFTQQTG